LGYGYVQVQTSKKAATRKIDDYSHQIKSITEFKKKYIFFEYSRLLNIFVSKYFIITLPNKSAMEEAGGGILSSVAKWNS